MSAKPTMVTYDSNGDGRLSYDECVELFSDCKTLGFQCPSAVEGMLYDVTKGVQSGGVVDFDKLPTMFYNLLLILTTIIKNTEKAPKNTWIKVSLPNNWQTLKPSDVKIRVQTHTPTDLSSDDEEKEEGDPLPMD